MIDTIYIPTLGRSHNQITFDNMTSNAQQITKLVVQPKEKHLYGNYPIIVLPNNDIGITETRKFIWKHGKESRYFVMDDDLKCACRKPWHIQRNQCSRNFGCGQKSFRDGSAGDSQ